MLDQLFSAAVQEADMGVDALNDLAVKLKHKAKHAVGRGVLGPEVEGEIADSGFHGASGLLLRQRGAVSGVPSGVPPWERGRLARACCNEGRAGETPALPGRGAEPRKPDGIDVVGN